MTMAIYLRGKPIMQAYDVGAGSCNAGDVIVVNDLPCVAHEDIPAFAGAKTLDALAISGGIYQMVADAAYPDGTFVYWNPTGQVVTTTSTGTVPFGWIVGGASDALSDGGPVSAAFTCSVFHQPNAGGGSLTYNLGANTNDNITNTSAETAFATTATIPAGELEAGDVIHVRAIALVTAQNSTNTNTFKLKIETAAATFTAVISTGALNLAANGLAIIDCDLFFTAVGNSGSFYAAGIQGSTSMAPFQLAATAINTNLAIVVEVTDTQSAANTGNVAQLIDLEVMKKRK